jgi:hypothetical protein
MATAEGLPHWPSFQFTELAISPLSGEKLLLSGGSNSQQSEPLKGEASEEIA